MDLSNLKYAQGSRKNRKKVGRGGAHGKTACRGHKGQRSRTSGNVRPGFEGGQMPLIRRVPKRGFTNPFRVQNQVVNLKDLNAVSGEDVNPKVLLASGLVSTLKRPVKILGTGEVSRAFVVKGCLLSSTARTKIEKAGGRIEA